MNGNETDVRAARCENGGRAGRGGCSRFRIVAPVLVNAVMNLRFCTSDIICKI
jgi:hypothetical protein